jgi:uncharacterized membrane protein YjgN (DUF898 family)
MNNIEASVPVREFRFEFTGNAREYFGIWIVNVLLTVLTLGIYSAWAKVRRKRYFYGHTRLHGSSFSYLADPRMILKGWGIAMVVFVVYSIVARIAPGTKPLFFAAFVLVLPWVIVRAAFFNARNTAYRNIRLNFDKNYRAAVKVYVGLLLLVPFTLGILYPYYAYRQKKFILDHSGYGGSRFSLDVGAGKFYGVYFKAMGIFIAGLLLMAMLAALLGVAGMSVAEFGKVLKTGMVTSLLLVMVATYFFVMVYLQTAVANLTWNNVTIAGNRFHSTLHFGRMLWIFFSNLVVIVSTLGLLAPWARIRATRYRFANLTMCASSDLDDFIARTQETQTGAAGEELSEVFGVEIGL